MQCNPREWVLYMCVAIYKKGKGTYKGGTVSHDWEETCMIS